MPRMYSIFKVLLVVALCGVWRPILALAQDPSRADTIAVITAPVPDMTISGQVVIMGSAGHPSAFAYYELEYKNLLSSGDIWLPIGQRVSQQKTNEILGIWDTVGASVSDGNYQIRLRVFLTLPDEAPVEFIVGTLQLINTAPTPLPAPETLESVAPTAGPSPTSAIEQPPTSTPRPTLESLAQNPDNNQSASSASTNRQSSLNLGRLQSAFCTGSLLAMIFFAVIGAYLAVRARFRPVARQLMWQIRSDYDDREHR